MEKAVTALQVDTFKDIAKRIIKGSIRSAICLDDVFEEPYMTTEEKKTLNQNLEAVGLKLDTDIPKNLYKSFRTKGKCDLDIYNFKTFDESWHPDYMLNNKDLVILDWELEGKDGYNSTLMILEEIIESDKVPFVIIYTYKPIADFREISKNIIQRFNSYSKENIQENKNKLIKQFDEHLSKVSDNKEWESDKSELFFEKPEIINLLLDFFLFPNLRSKNIELFYEAIMKEFLIDTKDKVQKKFKTVCNNVFGKEPLLALFNISHVFIGSETINNYKFDRIETNDIGFKINNCIITLFSKPGENNAESIDPENVFTKFSDLISSAPHNFITLLALEMRDRFREDLSKIGNEISSIDEKAFFVHLKNYQSRFEDSYKVQFYDFLLKSWINELNNYNTNLKPEIFSVIDEYIVNAGLENTKGSDNVVALANLAAILSSTIVHDRFERDNKIRFGDVFNLTTMSDMDEKIESESFFLSITPHCVCLDECKIDNNFYFIKSESSSDNFKSGLEKIETEYYSIIKNATIFKSVKWGECKPFTLYINPNTIDNLNSVYQNSPIELRYVTTLKENFAQRIANKAFGYGTAVGIDLPHIRRND